MEMLLPGASLNNKHTSVGPFAFAEAFFSVGLDMMRNSDSFE